MDFYKSSSYLKLTLAVLYFNHYKNGKLVRENVEKLELQKVQ